ncbi:HET-domain-containing protein [Xylariaceae sp. FL0662B]|nr:HET-domain-containing protein [Xylariaceae sp. FL0662B]
MRFLETQVAKETATLKLVEKRANETPNIKYAILSHTWEDDEVIFEDIESGRANYASLETPAALASLSKLLGACVQADNDGFAYIWIDSCCIDKRSSAELSEAINSMFAWYQDATICYAFLLGAPNELKTTESKTKFAKNRWFTRGWTLQELLAPAEVIFFSGVSGDWVPIGEKRLSCGLLADITGIDIDILLGDRPLTSASVARRMSWAAKRVTTRPEDSAYCLLGIFSVQMPMLYGEGKVKAFLRLQEEIMKDSDDQSLFAWLDLNLPLEERVGLLATEPSCFLLSGDVMPYQDWEPRAPYTVTNRGLRIDLRLTARSDGEYVAALDCPVPPDYKDSSFLAIYLRKLSDSDEQYARVRAGQFASVTQRGRLQTVYVRQKPQAPSPEGVFPHHFIQLRAGPPTEIYKVVRILFLKSGNNTPWPTKISARDWIPRKWPVLFEVLREAARPSVAIVFEREDGKRLAVLIGTLGGLDIAFYALELDADFDLEALRFEEFPFQPSITGRFELSHHSVRVSATPLVRTSSKFYLVDIGIEAIDLSLTEMVRKAYNVATGTGHGDTKTKAMPPALPEDENAGKTDGKVRKKPSLFHRLIR